MSRRFWRLAVGILATATMTRSAQAQLDPTGHWRSIRTPHFRVHFRPETEALGRRAAAEAERAYARIARELHPPRGTIDLVISDDADFSNGFASVSRSSVVIYAHPPIDAGALRFFDDWIELVLTHEITHIFHLDRVRGLWAVGQAVFGRHPGLFPNSYAPRWFTEGLAVYFESKLTGSGRLEGSEHRMIALAQALDGGARGVQDFSLGTSRFPYGSNVYVQGSLLVDYVARTRGGGAVRRIVDRASGSLLPLFMEPSTGVRWQAAWRELRDSLVHGLTLSTPLPEWREFAGSRHVVQWPRWLDDTSVVYAADMGKEVAGAYLVRTNRPTASPVRLGRRNTLDANTRLPDRSLVFAQLDFTDPYHIRSDLWIERGFAQRQLTHGARLAQPDAHPLTGRIVAVQGLVGTTRLVTLDVTAPDQVHVLRGGSLDTTWAEPRWSGDGTRIAAVRWRRGGWSAIVEIVPGTDTTRVLYESRAVNATPAWTSSGGIVFSSDVSGTTQLYALRPDRDGAWRTARLSSAVTGVFDPAPSPNGESLVATYYRGDGLHLGLAPMPPGAGSAAVSPGGADRRVDSVATPAKRYSPFQSLRPKYWEPRVESSMRGTTRLGAYTSGNDVIGRHSYVVEAFRDMGSGAVDVTANYGFRGFGRPEISLGYASIWNTAVLRNDLGGSYGELQQHQRAISLALSASQPRVRSSRSLGGGLTYQRYDFRVTPAEAADSLGPYYRTSPSYPLAFVSAGYSNVKRPALSISPEDGFSASFNAENSWVREAVRYSTRRYVADIRGYSGWDWGAFAHHVIAVRAAGGAADDRALSLFNVGGGSGSSVELVPGYTVGGIRRTFSVRGYPPGAQRGTRAAAGSVELRSPLVSPSRGLGILPFFIDRVSATTFFDLGTAFCRSSSDNPACARQSTKFRPLSSGGAELLIDAAPRFDFLYRFRVGVARAMSQLPGGGKPKLDVYFDFGTYF